MRLKTAYEAKTLTMSFEDFTKNTLKIPFLSYYDMMNSLLPEICYLCEGSGEKKGARALLCCRETGSQCDEATAHFSSVESV